jgi:CRISPR-associated endonuclease/helicase Cas3
MCARHRSNVLRQIRTSLKANAPCRVVSTSLIEAGVDVSFPLVMRAEAGLDSVAQAAGRCNREGVSAVEASNVLVFEPDTLQWKPPKELEQFAAVARQVFRRHASDPLNPSAIEDYFFELYWTQGTEALDAKDLLGLLRRATLDSLPFEDVARDYRLIDSVQATVIVPYDDVAKAAIQALASSGAAREPARTLQPYTVQVPQAAFQRLLAAGAVQAIAPDRWGDQFFELTNASLYDDQFGLFWDDPTFIHAAQLVQ